MNDDVEITLLDNNKDSANTRTEDSSSEVGCTDNNEPATLEIVRETQDLLEEGDEEKSEMAEITNNTVKPKKGSELDKFKRRLIRAIAHLMRNDQIPTDEIWDDLQKQSGCDCKLLWNRMRMLTMKKLQRLFMADDIVGNIAQVAQLTVTDWLLFDLVLVHEDLDVIGQDKLDTVEFGEYPTILEDLFATVVCYNLEHLTGDELTKAWFEATSIYNGKKRQCSPMLLQRRWYQLKSRVRDKFYQFWFRYRGAQRYLLAATVFKPTDLEVEIVKHFKYITTAALPTWEELIEQKKVALPEDFERLHLAKRRIFRTETGPDLELIEPQVETIDLDHESDSDESRDSTAVSKPNVDVDIRIVKTEKIDEISDDDVHVLESIQIPIETNEYGETASVIRNTCSNVLAKQTTDTENGEEDVFVINEGPNVIEQHVNIVENNLGIERAENEYIDKKVEDDSEIMMPTIIASRSIANVSINLDDQMPKISNVLSSSIQNKIPDDPVNSEINEILESAVENISSKNLFDAPVIDKLGLENADTLVKNINEEINSKIKESELGHAKKLDCFSALPNDMFHGIELEDDGIEYIEEDDDLIDITPKVAIKIEESDDNDNDNMPTIDLKLLLNPVVYTKKLDEMDVFRFIEFNTIKDKRVIENAVIESKPVDRNSVKMEEISQERQPTPDSEVFSDTASEYHNDASVDVRPVGLYSWLLNKPRIASYNPIQLCKNPDFNTRLKRLTAGFYSLERNRRLLKECKPLTIDVHKSFETKLCNNTLYLSGIKSMNNQTSQEKKTTDKTMSQPLVLPIENLKNNIINDFLGSSPDSSTTQIFYQSVLPETNLIERKKVNLPDLAQIRRNNERLLTAEVTPIQVTNNSKPPVNIVTLQQNIETLQSSKTGDVVKSLISSTVISSNSNTTPTVFNKIDLISDPTRVLQQDILRKQSAGGIKKSDGSSDMHLSLNDNNKIQTKPAEALNANCSLSRGVELQHKVGKETKKLYRINSVDVPWHSTRKIFIPDDVFLTSDTVDKILNICKGDVDLSLMNSKPYNKAMRKKALMQKTRKNFKVNQESKNEIIKDRKSPDNVPPKVIEVDSSLTVRKKSKLERSMEYIRSERKIYCCWAREKLTKLGTKKRVAKKHVCPRPLCNCCCRHSLIEKMFIMRRQTGIKYRAELSQLTIPKITVTSAPRPQLNDRNSPQKSYKISIGINTEFDPEFEKSFATKLEEFKSSSKIFNKEYDPAPCIKVTYPDDVYEYNSQTQTFVNLMGLNKNTSIDSTFTIESNSSDESNSFVPKNIPISSNESRPSCSFQGSESYNMTTEINVSSSAPALSIVSNPTNVIQKKVTLIKNPTVMSNEQCEISKMRNMFPDYNRVLTDHPYTVNSKSSRIASGQPVRITPRRPLPDLNPLILDNSHLVLQDRSKKSNKVLFLAKDSSKKSYSSPICLGKNKILLCSFDKSHRINKLKRDDVKNNDQMNKDNTPPSPMVPLPDGVRIVLLPNKELALSIDPGVELDQSQLDYLPNLMATIQKQLATADRVSNNFPEDPLRNEEDSTDHHNNISLNSCNENEIMLDENKQVKADNLNIAISSISNEELIDKSGEMATNSNFNQTECNIDITKNRSDSSKKTILSDLMEMSGISAEDTHSTNNLSPTNQQSELVVMPVLQGNKSQIANQHNKKYVNNPLFSNPAIQTALNMCPELCIVFSYEELRYASENNAQFFRMDVETGVVMPINLVIRRQVVRDKSNQQFVKDVIDLTEDYEEEKTADIKERIIETPDMEPIAIKQKGEPVPVKLFSTVRPSILQRGKSLLVRGVMSSQKPPPSILLRRKKLLQTIKKRKPATECSSIDLDSDAENNESTTVNEALDATPEKRNSDHSDSDDEPLALKSKRMKVSTEVNETINEIIEKDNNNDNSMIYDNNQEIEMSIDNESEVKEPLLKISAVDDSLKNITDEADIQAPPHLEPVVFDPINFGVNAAESSDDDCILGV